MSSAPADQANGTGPLEEMTIVDISQQLPGPYASMLLQELGARVTKIEPPAGDPSRCLDPEMFSLANRGKKVVTLDLKRASDVEALHRLVRDADVFIEGFRPGVASRLGADWETLSGLNPALVYCSISASGQEGPYARAPMHDLNLQGLAGLDEASGIGVPWVDLGTATTAALAVAAHWHRAKTTGRGVRLDAAMLDTAVLWAAVKASAHNRAEPTYGIFQTADGNRVAVAILEDHIWKRLCEALGWLDWRDNPALATYLQRVKSARQVRNRLEQSCRERSLDVLLELARRHDLPLTPAGSHMDQAARAQLSARHLSSRGSVESSRLVPIPLFSPIELCNGNGEGL